MGSDTRSTPAIDGTRPAQACPVTESPPRNLEPPDAARAEAGGSSGLGTGSKQVGPAWRIVGLSDPTLVGIGAPNWDALELDGRAELVKENPVRRVWRVRYAGRVFYAKTFLGRRLGIRIRRLLRCAPEQTEWRVARYAAEHDLGCVRMLGFLQPLPRRPTPVRSVLISEEVPGAVSLADQWQQVASIADAGERRRTQNAMIGLVANLLADAHRERFLHLDPHPGNVLMGRDAASGFLRAVFADLQRARVGRSVSDRQAAANVAALAQWFHDRASLTQQLRFLKAYLERRERWTAAFARTKHAHAIRRRFAEAIDEAARKHAERLHAKRDRRIFGNNAYFGTACVGGGWRATLTLRFRRRDLPPPPSQPDRSLAEWIEWARRSLPDLGDRRRCEECVSRMGLRLVRRTPPTAWEFVTWQVRGSPLRRRYRDAHRARNRDRPVASPIALFERRRLGFVVEALLLVESEDSDTR